MIYTDSYIFDVRIFPGFSGSGFFPEIFLVPFCALKNSWPFEPFCHQLQWHQSFCYLAEAGRYEKCKKHTFLALRTIFVKNVVNKKCSELNNKNFWENFFSGIPDPDFHPDSTFSGFFESVVYMDHFCQRIFQLYQMVDL